MLRTAALVLALGAISASAVAGPAEDGPPVDWKKRIDAYLDKTLKDPYSAVRAVSRGPRYDEFKIGLQKHTGWGVCYSVNAKNSYGAFIGAENMFFIVPEYGLTIIIDPAELASQYAASVTREQIERECAKPATPPPVRSSEGG